MHVSLDIINKYLDICPGSAYYRASEAKKEKLSANKQAQPRSVIESYKVMLSVDKMEKIRRKWADVIVSISGKDPLFLLDAVIIYIDSLPDSHPDMALPVKSAYIEYRNSIGNINIQVAISWFYEIVFKTITGYDVKKFYPENVIRDNWFPIVLNSHLETIEVNHQERSMPETLVATAANQASLTQVGSK